MFGVLTKDGRTLQVRHGTGVVDARGVRPTRRTVWEGVRGGGLRTNATGQIRRKMNPGESDGWPVASRARSAGGGSRPGSFTRSPISRN